MSLPKPAGFRGTFRIDDDARGVYSESAGILRLVPLGVALPNDGDDVVTLCRWARQTGIPLIPRGSGSSMSGAAVGPGVVMDLYRLRETDSVDTAWQRIRTDPAATRSHIDALARECGLRFPVDPSSGPFATIGGMCATNAAGPRSMAFGAMRRWVRSLDCVFADGSRAIVTRGEVTAPGCALLDAWHRIAPSFRERCRRIEPRAVRKNSSGFALREFAESGDLVDLLVGSEGTLAVFTAVELWLAPLPVATATILASWQSLDAAMLGAQFAREAQAVACELLDATFLRIAEAGGSLPIVPGAECVLLIELEGGSDGAVRARANALSVALERAGADHALVGLDAESEESLWSIRHAASATLSRLDPGLRSMQIVEDACVPPERIADYIRGVRSALGTERLRGVIFGHAGDAHVHVNALVDVNEREWQSRVRGLFDSITDLTARLGGTPAGEHGDGRLRTPVLDRFCSREELALFGELKAQFDPDGILNPGVKTSADIDPFDRIKYDRALPRLSPAAERALGVVERERGYDRCRLDLLLPPA